MAVTYGFYDSLNHDRLYNAQQMSAIFDGIINDGVFMSVGNQFHTVAGTGMQVIVKSGRAWFDSTWTLNDAEYPLSIDAADVLLTRIDAVVLEVNSEVATRANTIKVVKGTPASTPAKPTLTNTATIHQHALAYVTVAKNITAITNSMIEIVVGKTETPYVTAILQTTDISDLFKKWENDFQVWFETVKGTLDGDVALNLQNQIDHRVKKADKATSADIEAGTADKWVDSALLKKKSLPIGTILERVQPSLTYWEDEDNSWMIADGQILRKDIYTEYYNISNRKVMPKSFKTLTEQVRDISPDGKYVYTYRVTGSDRSHTFVLKYRDISNNSSEFILKSYDMESGKYWGNVLLTYFSYPYIYVIEYDRKNYICALYKRNVVDNSQVKVSITNDLDIEHIDTVTRIIDNDVQVAWFLVKTTNSTSSVLGGKTCVFVIDKQRNAASTTTLADNGYEALSLFHIKNNIFVTFKDNSNNEHYFKYVITLNRYSPATYTVDPNFSDANILYLMSKYCKNLSVDYNDSDDSTVYLISTAGNSCTLSDTNIKDAIFYRFDYNETTSVYKFTEYTKYNFSSLYNNFSVSDVIVKYAVASNDRIPYMLLGLYAGYSNTTVYTCYLLEIDNATNMIVYHDYNGYTPSVIIDTIRIASKNSSIILLDKCYMDIDAHAFIPRLPNKNIKVK